MLITLQQLKSSLQAVKNYINNVMPKKASDLQNDAGYLTQHQDISGKANVSDLATVATSGSYNDLSNKPTIQNILDVGTSVTASADLNTYTTPGTYVVDSTVMSSVINAPTTTVGYKLVVDVIGSNTVKQTATTTDGKSYIRSGDNFTSSWVWSNWATMISSTDYATSDSVGVVKIGDGLSMDASTGKVGVSSSYLNYLEQYTPSVDFGRFAYGGDFTKTVHSMTFTKKGALFTVNGTKNTSSFYAYFLGKDNLYYAQWDSSHTPTSAAFSGYKLLAGHRYMISVRIISGSSDGVISTRYHYIGYATYNETTSTINRYSLIGYTDSSATSAIVAPNSFARVLEPETDLLFAPFLMIQNETVFNNLTFSFDVKDITAVLNYVNNSADNIAFYGLAEASGDTTQAQSDNAVGTYTDNAKTAINTMIGSVSKDSLDNAGISARTYTTLFGGEFSVTTADNNDYISPYARASVTGRISKHYIYRVTVNETEYKLPCRLWFQNTNDENKVYEYIGNIGLYVSDISGVTGDIDSNLDFIIISDLNDANSIDVLTQTAGNYTIKVERVNETLNKLPKSLIYKDYYVPFEVKNNDGTYNGLSFGVNELKNSRGSMAFGYANKISDDFGIAFGINNSITSDNSFAFGSDNNITSSDSFAFGRFTNVTADEAFSFGYETTSNCNNMFAIGKSNILANTVFPNWANNTYYKKGDTVTADYGQLTGFIWRCRIPHTSAASGTFQEDYQNRRSQEDLLYWEIAPSNGDTAFVIGNGGNNRSNAYKVDWAGNAYYGGDVYVNCADDSTGGTKLISETDYASDNSYGVVKTHSYYGTFVYSSSSSGGILSVYPASDGDVKGGSTPYRPIVPGRQHASVFYGLARAAGDTTQSTSNNAVGTYTDTAKTKIKEMLGVEKTVTVSGTTPTITAEADARYICGEVTSLSFTPCASGICDIQFTSGSTVTVLNLPSTVKFPNSFDPTSLETNTVYEINILDGVYGVVMSWAV